MTTAYPLHWPDGWPRTPPEAREDGRYRFRKPNDRRTRPGDPLTRFWTFAEARNSLLTELRLISSGGAPIISSNFRSNSGIPIEEDRRPADQGIAIYFQLNGKPYVMACDRFTRAEENMRSLALALEAMRQLERHGGGFMMERAFEGFSALPPPATCWEILGIQPNASEAEILAAYRRKAMQAHPDQGGSDAAMAELNRARDEALRAIGTRVA